MARRIQESHLQPIEAAVQRHPEGMTAQRIADALDSAPPRRTLQYRLKYLVDNKRLAMTQTGSALGGLITRDAGVQSVIARGARSSRRRFGTAIDLFAQGMVEIHVKPNRELQSLVSFETTRARP